MYKSFHDNIWENIEIPLYCTSIIDTYEFQRMRNMKQLGSSYYHYSSASGNRFEHSIGVCYLANYTINKLKSKFPNIVSENHVKLITIAGLLHDIGHGPFSHLFEKVTNQNHEIRSVEIIKFMRNKYNLDLNDEELDIVFRIINPYNEKNWLYQIVSNKVDVDRIDYIIRDAVSVGMTITFNKNNAKRLLESISIENDQIVYINSEKIIEDLLNSRNFMFERVYLSKKTIQIENLIVQILKTAGIVERIKTIEDFIKLDDSIIHELYWNEKTKHLVENLVRRQF